MLVGWRVMSRLVDADKLIEDIEKIARTDMMKVLVENWINKQPTAYDVDKVVEQLESLKKIAEIMRNIDIEHNAYIEEAYERGRIYVLNEALEIVKAGGIDE